jgi:hypothetical protein
MTRISASLSRGTNLVPTAVETGASSRMRARRAEARPADSPVTRPATLLAHKVRRAESSCRGPRYHRDVAPGEVRTNASSHPPFIRLRCAPQATCSVTQRRGAAR